MNSSNTHFSLYPYMYLCFTNSFFLFLLNSVSGKNTHLTSISASGHAVPPSALGKLAKGLGNSQQNVKEIAIGDNKLGDEGVVAFCGPLEETNGGKVQVLDLSFKGM